MPPVSPFLVFAKALHPLLANLLLRTVPAQSSPEQQQSQPCTRFLLQSDVCQPGCFVLQQPVGLAVQGVIVSSSLPLTVPKKTQSFHESFLMNLPSHQSHSSTFLFPFPPTLATAGVEIFVKLPCLAHFPLCITPVPKSCHMATQCKAFIQPYRAAYLKAILTTHKIHFCGERREKERENIHRSQNPLFGRMAFK